MDFAAIIQTWIGVLTKPGEPVFEQERAKPDATLTTAVIWMVIAALVGAVLAALRFAVFRSQLAAMGGFDALFKQANLPPELQAQISGVMNTVMGSSLGWGGIASSIVTGPAFFLIGVGFFWLIARLVGGKGDYGRYAYLMATFNAPLSILSGLLSFVPVLGGCVGIVVMVYQLVLTYFATKVEHNLTSGRALVVVLFPVILVLVLVLCLVVFAGAALISVNNQ